MMLALSKRVLEKRELYSIYEVLVNDTRYVEVVFSNKKKLSVRDDDDVVSKRLYLFEEELRLKPLLYTAGKPRLIVQRGKVVLFVGERHFQPRRIEKKKVKWDFLFNYTFTFDAVMEWGKKGFAIEIPLYQLEKALEVVVRESES